MFEAAQLGRTLSKKKYDQREPELHSALLVEQRRLKEANFPVIIIVSGVEGAGKGDFVSMLHKWMDVRGLQTHAFWEETDEERLRPRYWRFWRAMPARGATAILFGSWYTQPIIDCGFGRIDQDRFDRMLERVRHFEDMLVDDGTLIIKLWFHMSKQSQRAQIKADAKGNGGRVSPMTKEFAKRYKQLMAVSERALRKTDVAHSPWHIIEAECSRYRNIRAGEVILERLADRLDRPAPTSGRETVSSMSLQQADEPSVLSNVPDDLSIAPQRYKKQIEKYQNSLYKLAWAAKANRIDTIAVFEGWDAAGKGGAIRRVSQAMDARLYRVISVAAPTDEEQAHHYLWRFWRHLPRDGYVTLYDRSWYGRVLVERVEEFATKSQWQRAYNEINSFEEQLVEHGAVLLKFWIHIDRDEQLRRFRERESTPWKRHKITDEDWRNRERWNEYELSVSDMVLRTSTEIAPWTLVPGNDKRYARIEILKIFCERLEAALDQHP